MSLERNAIKSAIRTPSAASSPRRARSKQYAYLHRGRPLVVDLTIKHHEFAHAVHHQHAAFYLQPVDELGRVLRFTEVYVPLGRAVVWDY